MEKKNTMEKISISKLLKSKLVVPEIQREYVWGSDANKAVLEQFLDSLNTKFKSGKDANIGFLYSYQNGDEHYIIDGQQRFTTIVLLLYRLALEKKDAPEMFPKLMGLTDDRPSFTYRVRSNTASFLENLFLSQCSSGNEIKNQKWYKLCYEQDQTIQAMIHAIDQIDSKVTNPTNHLTFDKILNQVTFWYFDVQNTSEGEELYITMNSRGQKLTQAEQLKPRLFKKLNIQEKLKYGKLWEDWCNFFFKLRGDRGIESVDVAMNNVARLTLELKTPEEHNEINPVKDSENIDISHIHKVMDAIQFIVDELKQEHFIFEVQRLYGESPEDDLKDGRFFVLKSLIVERMKGTKDLREYDRVFHVIRNQVRRHALNHKPLLKFLSEYLNLRESSFYDFFLKKKIWDDPKKDSDKELQKDELEKVQIYRTLNNDGENLMWKAQVAKLWNGDISPLIEWAKDEKNNFSIETFKKYNDLIIKIFSKKPDKDPDEYEWPEWYDCDDLFRRALICCELNNYPRWVRNFQSFGYHSYEWISIFKDNLGKLKSFFDNYEKQKNSLSLNKYCEGIIDNYKNTDNFWYSFAKNAYLLKYCEKKCVHWSGEHGLELVKNDSSRYVSKRVSANNKHLFESLSHLFKDNSKSVSGWKVWPYWERGIAGRVVVENEEKDFVFDNEYWEEFSGEKKIFFFTVSLWQRNSEPEKMSKKLKQVAENNGFVKDESGWFVRKEICEMRFDDNGVFKAIARIAKLILDVVHELDK